MMGTLHRWARVGLGALLVGVAAGQLAAMASAQPEPKGKGKPDAEKKVDKKKAEEEENARVAVAKAQVLTLDKAIQTYCINNDTWPARLADLAKPDAENDNKPYVEKGALVSPWGKPYLYDVRGPRNKGAKPDVYITTPGGKVIGNFRSPPAKPKPK